MDLSAVDHDPRPATLTAAALACFSVANGVWLHSDGTESPRWLVDDAMCALQPGSF